MFWDKGYTPSANIEALLEKENATVEEFLDDEDILVECKSQKKSIVNYFTRPDVIKRLVELIITEPSDVLPMAQRYRHANMACEILTLGLPSLDEKLLSDAETLRTLYSYLENEPPLNPLLSSFFSKTFSMLFTKKAEQDWFLYQQMCLQLLEYIKSQNNFLDLICKHFSTPVIPDLIMQMMKDVEGGQIKRNLYEWLTEDKLVERLIALLGNPQESDKHANVAEFLCDLIQQGRSMRQTEQENDSFEPAFDGSNPILQSIESEATIEALLNVILEPNAQESAIVSGISVVLTLIKPVVFVDEPNTDRLKYIQNREKEIHEQILNTVIRVIAPRLKDFNELLRNPPKKPEVVTTAAKLSPPFGMTRLQICRLFTVLLQTKNEDISKAICDTDFFETLLALFKQYCWNNFLHSEVEKCIQLIFYTQLSNNNNSTQGSTVVNDGSFSKHSNNDENTTTLFDFIFRSGMMPGSDDSKPVIGAPDAEEGNTMDAIEMGGDKDDIEMAKDAAQEADVDETAAKAAEEAAPKTDTPRTSAVEMETEETAEADAANAGPDTAELQQQQQESNDSAAPDGDGNESDTTKVHVDSGPSALQTHVIVQCKLISKLIDCWKHNKDLESVEKGRRLGYMGHLIKIFKHITNCISESEHIGALIESNLSDASELELWQSIINPNDGDFTRALATQSKMLANCNAHEAGDYSQHLPKDFLSDNSTWDYIMSANIINTLNSLGDCGGQSDVLISLDADVLRNGIIQHDGVNERRIDLFQFARNIDDDDDDEDENTAGGDVGGGGGGGHSLFGKSAASTSALQTFGVTNNPWDNMDPFSDLSANSNVVPWAADLDNFADFDSHFSSFTNDLGESLVHAAKENEHESNDGNTGSGNKDSSDSDSDQTQNAADNEKVPNSIESRCKAQLKPQRSYDNNANVQKTFDPLGFEQFADASPVQYNDSKIGDPDYDKKIRPGAFCEDAEAVTDANSEKALRTAVVRTLQSVMQDSEDDYEDDEGMWTKPLGGSAAQEDAESESQPKASEQKTLANGPSSKQVVENENKELNKPNEDITTTTVTPPTTTNETSAVQDSESARTPAGNINANADGNSEAKDNVQELDKLAKATSLDNITDGTTEEKLRAAVLSDETITTT